MKKAIVTGSTSFIGRAMVKKLEENGFAVTALRHSLTGIDRVDLPVHPDIWLHFAWAGRGSMGRKDTDIQRYNVRMSLEALKKAVLIGTSRFIFAGSQAEYGHAQDGTLKKEDLSCKPLSQYARAKFEFGKRAREYLDGISSDMEYVHMRIFSCYGPGDHEDSLINTLIKKLSQKENVSLGYCAQLWDYIYIDDLTNAIMLLCKKAHAGSYNIGSGDIRPLSEYVLMASSIILSVSDPGEFLRFGTHPDNAEGDADLSPDISKLSQLGFRREVTFEEGIRRLIDRG